MKSRVIMKICLLLTGIMIIIAPVIATAAPAESGKNYIVIDKKTKMLTVYVNNKQYKSYHVAIGKEESPTPVGDWIIKRKARHWGTGFGTRWMGLNVPWGLYGIHGTNKPWSIGSAASHGCIRMLNRDVEELYDLVAEGSRVSIKGMIYPPFYEERRTLHSGHRGSDVMLLQMKLKEQGYFQAEIDGFFGKATEKALKQFQKEHYFEVTGQVDADIYAAVGL